MAGKPGLQVIGKNGSKHEKTPHAVYDARYGGQQFYCSAKWPFEPDGSQFGQKKRDTETHRNCDNHCNARCDESPCNRDECPEFPGDRIPFVTSNKPEEVECLYGRIAACKQGDNNRNKDAKNEACRDAANIFKDYIAKGSVWGCDPDKIFIIYQFGAHIFDAE